MTTRREFIKAAAALIPTLSLPHSAGNSAKAKAAVLDDEPIQTATFTIMQGSETPEYLPRLSVSVQWPDGAYGSGSVFYQAWEWRQSRVGYTGLASTAPAQPRIHYILELMVGIAFYLETGEQWEPLPDGTIQEDVQHLTDAVRGFQFRPVMGSYLPVVATAESQ